MLDALSLVVLFATCQGRTQMVKLLFRPLRTRFSGDSAIH